MQVEEGEMDGKTGLTTSATDGRTGATPLAPVVLQHQIQVGSHPSFNSMGSMAGGAPARPLGPPPPLCVGDLRRLHRIHNGNAGPGRKGDSGQG